MDRHQPFSRKATREPGLAHRGPLQDSRFGKLALILLFRHRALETMHVRWYCALFMLSVVDWGLVFRTAHPRGHHCTKCTVTNDQFEKDLVSTIVVKSEPYDIVKRDVGYEGIGVG